MCKTIISGFVSVKSVIEAKSRKIYRIFIEKERYDSVMRSNLRIPEQRQYKALTESGIDCEFYNKDEFSALVANEGSGGIAAEVGERIFKNADGLSSLKGSYIAMLDGIEDPFNFAYSLRSLYAAGVDAVILPERNFFTASEIVIRSSAGASELLNIYCVPDLAQAVKQLKNSGYTIISTAKTDKAKDLYKVRVSRPLCLIFGGEKRGIKKEIIDLSDITVKLKYPRDCHYSLPACSAVSVISFEIAKKLSDTGRPAK